MRGYASTFDITVFFRLFVCCCFSSTCICAVWLLLSGATVEPAVCKGVQGRSVFIPHSVTSDDGWRVCASQRKVVVGGGGDAGRTRGRGLER